MNRVSEVRSGTPLLKAPRDNGGWLVDSVPKSLANRGGEESTVAAIRRLCTVDMQAARQELVELAAHYTSQYREIGYCNNGIDKPIILAGHQPQWFHPGVWFKNGVLDRLAAIHAGVGINLIVDNDLCTSTALRVPVGSLESVRFESLALDLPADAVPWEERKIGSMELLGTAAERLIALRSPWITQPLLVELQAAWKSSAVLPRRLGELFALARHRVEQAWGWTTLELPLSQVCETLSFRRFAASLWSDAPRLLQVYNQALHDHRQNYRIRSRSHPVPDLQADGDWTESPFWVWTEGSPTRKRLFVRTFGSSLELTDRAQWQWRGLVEDWFHASDCPAGPEVRLRTRALTTTWYARAILSDLFVHGIGGAHYDRLTDDLVRRYWGYELPAYVTATSTVRLDVAPREPSAVEKGMLSQSLRALDYQPERAIERMAGSPPMEIRQWLEIKRDWIERSKTEELSYEDRVARHQAIVGVNERLQPLAEATRQATLQQIQQLELQARQFRILGSREYSIAIHPADRLKQSFDSLLQSALGDSRRT